MSSLLNKTEYTEVLSPAGDFDCLKAAVRFRADAVYMGGNVFTMRAAASNGIEDIRKAAEYAHKNGVKLYITLNTLPRNPEIPFLDDYLKQLKECNVDALIVSDLGVFSACKRVVPDIDIHMSTQTGIVNYESARVLYEMGAKRVVLARELSPPFVMEY